MNAGGQGAPVFGAEHPVPFLRQCLGELPCSRIPAAVPQVGRDVFHAGIAGRQDRLGVRQQPREHRPGVRLPGFTGESGLDQSGGGLPPGLMHTPGHLVGGDRLDQAVHRGHPVPGRAYERVPAQSCDRIPGGQLVIQQRLQHLGHLRVQLADRSGGGRSSRRKGTGSGAQHASSRSSPAAPGAESCSCPNASAQVVATVPA